jgi:hypothetical protein
MASKYMRMSTSRRKQLERRIETKSYVAQDITEDMPLSPIKVRESAAHTVPPPAISKNPILERLVKILRTPPMTRSSYDISQILEFTQNIAFFAKKQAEEPSILGKV